MNQVLTGKFIADERKKKGYTQMDLADKLGISNRTVSKWERGVSHSYNIISTMLPILQQKIVELIRYHVISIGFSMQLESDHIQYPQRMQTVCGTCPTSPATLGFPLCSA